MFPKCVPVFLARCQWRKWKKQSGDCKFHNNNHPQTAMFEESANRHLILSTRQQSSKIRHIRFAFYRSAICQEKVQEHSWTWMVCYFIQQEGYVKTHWRSSKLVQKFPKVDIVGSMHLLYFSSSQSRFCTASNHTLQTRLRFVAWSPSVTVSTFWNKWVSWRTLWWMEMHNDSERRGMNFDLPYLLSIVEFI